MASNEEILKRIHAEKVINWNQIFRQNPTIIESAYEAMDAARRDEAVAALEWARTHISNGNDGTWDYEISESISRCLTSEEAYTIFKQQNS